MASWKKVIVSGSAISQLNNDSNFISSTGGGILSSSAQIAAEISGSFTSTSASIASDIAGISTSFTLAADSGTNDTFNSSETLTFSGGNGIDTVVSDNNIAINGVAGLVSGSAQVVALVEAGTDSNTFTDADHTKLDGIEARADVTDTDNVTAAGALMDSEVTDLAGIKGVTISTLQVKPSEGAFADGDKTKLDAIEASADVTDTANVTAAGALMDSELTDLAGVKGVTISTLQVKPSEGAFANGDKTKLDGIEASADVTDTANVTSAGALMDSELASIADVKALDQSVVSGASPTFGTANMTDASNKRFMTDAQETKLDSVEANATADQTAAEILTAIKTVDGASSGLDADLLDGKQGDNYVQGTNANRTTSVTDISTALPSGFFDGYQVTGTPTSTWYTYINSRHNNTTNNYGSQIACSFYNAGDFYVRNVSAGTYGSWNKIWNEA